MKVDTILKMNRIAFSNVPYPGDSNIVHCSYDKKHGGVGDSPCSECSEVFEVFVGQKQFNSATDWIRSESFGFVSITPQAFQYFLPAAVDISLRGLDQMGSVSESLEFRFQGLDPEEWQDSRIGLLSSEQLDVMDKFFEYENKKHKYLTEEYRLIKNTITKYRERLF